MSFQLLLEDWQGSSIPDGGGKIIPPARNGERECSGEGFWASLWWFFEELAAEKFVQQHVHTTTTTITEIMKT